jgi:apolipoprotein D and lipocalin family protein
MKNFILTAFLLTLMLVATDISAQKTNSSNQVNAVTPVSSVDLKQYSGKWFEIARYQNKFQKNCIGNTTATYKMKEEGKFEVLNECLRKNGTVIDAKGEGKIIDKNSNAKLEVRFAPGYLAFLPSVRGDYWIIDLDTNYQYAVVGDPKREYLWVLSRTPEMNVATYQNILRRLETMGYKPGKLVKTPQNVEVVKGSVIQKQ